MNIIAQLLQYAAFRGLLFLAAGICLALVGFLVAFVLMHLLYTLGRRSLIYKKHKPAGDWGRRFYPASFLLIAGLLLFAYWLRTLAGL